MTLRRVVFAFAVLALAVSSAVAQEFRATINGRVMDTSGTGVPGAKVTTKNIATNETSVVETTADGDYTAPFLLPGKYNVTAEAKGFKQSLHENVEVRVNEKVSVNFQLEIGAVSESVTVTAA